MNGIGLAACRGFMNGTDGGLPPSDVKSVQLVIDGPCRQFAKSEDSGAAEIPYLGCGKETSTDVPLSERRISDASCPARNTRIIESWLEQSVLSSGVELSADALRAAAAGGEASVPKKELKLLEEARLNAARTLRALDAFTGRELADFNVRPAVLEALQAAIEGQMKLADVLMQAASRTGSAKLMTLSTSANLRACEISRLACEMKMCADGDLDAPQWDLDSKGQVDRIAEVSVRSHGTMAALARDEKFDRLFAALGELEDQSSADEAPVQVAKVANLLAECAGRLAELKRSVTDVAALESLEQRLAEAHERFADARHSAVRKIALDFVNGWKLPEACEKDALQKLLAEARPQFPPSNAAENILSAAERLSQAYKQYKDAWLERFDLKRHDRDDARLKDAYCDLWDALEEFYDEGKSWPGFLNEVGFNSFVHDLKHSHQAALRLERISEAGCDFSRHDALALLDGRLEFGSVAAAAGWGYGPERVDGELAGAKLVNEEVKGAGSFNTVKLCTFRRPDGTECQRVFKGENGAWLSLSRGTVGIISDYNDNQLGIDVNFASHDLAELVGCGGRIVKSHFGTLDGVPGFFQEVAPGISATHKNTAPDDGAFSFADFYAMRNDPDEAKRALYRKMAGEFCRQLNQLQWLDLLSGQVDRSYSNLMVRLGKDGSVSVKGIDNDQSFPSAMTGLWLLKFDPTQAEELKKCLGSEGWEKCVKRGAIVTDADSGKLTVDVNGFGADEFVMLLKSGFRSLFVPNHMDKDMLDAIRSLVDDPERLEGYRQKLRSDHLTEDQVNAAVSRLQAVRALGEHLEKIGRVFDAHGEPNGWEPSDQDIFDKLDEEVQLKNERGSTFLVRNLARTFVPKERKSSNDERKPMSGISMETFRAIANNSTIEENEQLVLEGKERITLVPGGAEHEISAGKTRDDSRYMRTQLLLQAGLALGQNPDVFGKLQDMLFGGVNGGKELAYTPLSRREIAAVIKLTDEAVAAKAQGAVGADRPTDSAPAGDVKDVPVKYRSPNWKSGVPKLETGVILKQTNNNTCFACSVLNGIANSPKLAAHFESLVDRTKSPPTFKLYTKTGRREYALNETFGLPEGVLKTIAKSGATEFEKFLMRYLASSNDDYVPGVEYSDDIVANALGLVRVKMGSVVDDPPPQSDSDSRSKAKTGKSSSGGYTIAWSQLDTLLKAGCCVTSNIAGRHFVSIVAADEKGCMIVNSSSGKESRSTKKNALGWNKTILSFYDLPSEGNMKVFRSEVEKFGAKDLMEIVGSLKAKLIKKANDMAASILKDAAFQGLGLETASQLWEYLGKNPPSDPKLLGSVNDFKQTYQEVYACERWLNGLKSEQGPGAAEKIKAAFDQFHSGCVEELVRFQDDFDPDPIKARKYLVNHLRSFIWDHYLHKSV